MDITVVRKEGRHYCCSLPLHSGASIPQILRELLFDVDPYLAPCAALACGEYPREVGPCKTVFSCQACCS